MAFMLKNRMFAKTGSGQTWEQLQNDEPFHFSCAGEDYWMSARHQRTEDDEAWEVSLSW